MRWAWAVGCGVLVGCQAVGLACTEMGCAGSITILLDRAPTEGAGIEVDLGDGDVRICTSGGDPSSCTLDTTDGDVVLEIGVPMGSAPETIVVTVDEGAVIDHDVAITWGEPYYPNGKACDGADGGCAAGEGALTL